VFELRWHTASSRTRGIRRLQVDYCCQPGGC
jgi:hypothetical protein